MLRMKFTFFIFVPFLSVIVSCYSIRGLERDYELINNYLNSANHLTEEQKKKIREGEPFIGMTIKEAEIAMDLLESRVTLNGDILYGLYRGARNTEYHVYFNGIPLRVSFWSVYEFDDIELREPYELHPITPF